MYNLKSLLTFSLAALSSVSAYTLSNVTYASNNTEIQLFPVCAEQTARSCPGAWWNDFDPRFLNGVAKICGDPRMNWGFQNAYMAFTFRGSAFYVYQWVNASVAHQELYLDSDQSQLLTPETQIPNLTGDLQLAMTWSAEGLDPLQEHTIGIQQVPDPSRGNTWMIIDYIVVTQTTLEEGDIPKKKPNTKAIVGGVVGGVLGFIGLILGCCVLRRWNLRRAAAARNAGSRYEWQGEPAIPVATVKLDPSSEIEASERIAREGRLEEEAEKEKQLAALTEHV